MFHIVVHLTQSVFTFQKLPVRTLKSLLVEFAREPFNDLTRSTVIPHNGPSERFTRCATPYDCRLALVGQT